MPKMDKSLFIELKKDSDSFWARLFKSFEKAKKKPLKIKWKDSK